MDEEVNKHDETAGSQDEGLDLQAQMDQEDAEARREIQGETDDAGETAATQDEPADETPAVQEDDSADAGETPATQAESFRDPAALVEAILFTTDAPLAAAKIVQVSELAGVKVVKQAVKALNQKYEQMGCSFRIEEIGGGFLMMTLPEYHDVLGRLSKARSDSKLSQAGLEALAIIAYRQPILRADIEAIRGVASGEVLRTLMEKQLVKIVGRAEVIGRPMLYGTTRRFLDVFGLANLEDLPRVEELKTGTRKAAVKNAESPEQTQETTPASEEPAAEPMATPADPAADPTDAVAEPTSPPTQAPADGQYQSDSTPKET